MSEETTQGRDDGLVRRWQNANHRVIELTAERDRLREAALMALRFIDQLGEHSPTVTGREAEVYEALRKALYPDT